MKLRKELWFGFSLNGGDSSSGDRAHAWDI